MAKRPTARARASRASHDVRGKYAPPKSSSSSSALSNLKSDYLDSTSSSSAFDLKVTKKDKRHIRHGHLLAKVREGGISKADRLSGGKPKTRRPNKKLKTDLGDMADVLDDVDIDMNSDNSATGGGERSGVYAEDEWEGVSETSEQEREEGSERLGKVRRRRRRRVGAGAGADGKMVMKSLRHRPGSMKRKKVLEERERERFGRNLAELAKAEGGGSGSAVAAMGEGGGGGGDEHIQQRWKALRAFIGDTMQKDKAFETV
ncbi:Putative ribosome biogenesis protein Slx9 [Septoria linicola]|uniref:Ribosome biogenesis protein SLX9 n=1 Tax=Septoria linicola TaxID=215465 RepID=A0A9Q9B647_9PEZI|nr:putative ribosome biogenesis protein Slx9 [Septoria linicola]USW58168.1 Putative ribosome biogenesis protein Slx9 [Septoria linicola]